MAASAWAWHAGWRKPVRGWSSPRGSEKNPRLQCESWAAKRCGRIDILVNNAGINIRKPAHDLQLEEWKQVMDTNLTSAFLCSRAAYPHFQRAGGGKIINIGSMMSIFGASFA